ncbi:MAG: hypothetical protein IJO71_01520 [Microbacterium sp.]|uniref:ApeA N-terminal domain 1-containing protein n=1 Tax=Microbacterium sp. TaxID=51671 RepID=UPI0025CBBAED|nr:HEPN domain-containing protein [Microbacterium sp.]MBQ9915865.1 hypothetical protein [Microbacterium sp.]
MSGKTWRGYWWLPLSPDDRAPGQLVIADDGGCRLELVGGLNVPVGAGDHVPVIIGEAEGKSVTLLDCFTIARDGLGGRPNGYHDLHVHEALIGAHVGDSEPAFRAAILSIENLTTWLAVDSGINRSGDEDAESATAHRPATQTCTVDGWEITARGLLQPFQVSAERSRVKITSDISAYLVLTPPAPCTARDFHRVVLELMDLVTLAAGEPSGQIELTLVHRDPIEHRDVDGTVFEVERRVDSLGARIHTAQADGQAQANWRFLFTCADRRFDELVPDWLAIRRRAPEACNVLFGLQYSRPTYTEVRLLLTAITAETLHSSLYGDDTELAHSVFEDIRSRVLSALTDEDELRWVRQRLRNTPSFRERMVSLAALPDADAVNEVVPDVTQWARRLRDARDNLAHTGNETTGDDIFRLERATTSLLALVLMAELKLPAETQRRAARDVLRI